MPHHFSELTTIIVQSNKALLRFLTRCAVLTHLEGRLAFVLGSWDYLEVCEGSDNDALILEALGASVKCLTVKARPSLCGV